MLVYKITNEVNGHGYIGITQCTLKKRWREHLCAARTGSTKRLYKAMRKYGTDNFSIRVLHTANSFAELQALEQAMIIEHNTYAGNMHGYNLTNGGEGRDRVDQFFGSQVYNSVLTDEIVALLRNERYLKVSNKDMLAIIASRFGVVCSRDTVKDARSGKSWTHLNVAYPPVKRGRGVRNDVVPPEIRAKQVATLAKYHKVAIDKAITARMRGKQRN